MRMRDDDIDFYIVLFGCVCVVLWGIGWEVFYKLRILLVALAPPRHASTRSMSRTLSVMTRPPIKLPRVIRDGPERATILTPIIVQVPWKESGKHARHITDSAGNRYSFQRRDFDANNLPKTGVEIFAVMFPRRPPGQLVTVRVSYSDGTTDYLEVPPDKPS